MQEYDRRVDEGILRNDEHQRGMLFLETRDAFARNGANRTQQLNLVPAEPQE